MKDPLKKSSRRDLIRWTGTAGTISFVGTTAATGKTTDPGVLVTEATLKYEVESRDTPHEDLALSEVDYPQKYIEKGSNLALTTQGRKKLDNIPKKGGHLQFVNGVRNHSNSIGGTSVSSLPVSTSRDGRPTTLLALSEPFTEPQVSIERTQNSLEVASPKGMFRIAPGKKQSQRMAARPVTASVFRGTNQHAVNNNIPEWKLANQTEKDESTVTVRPKIAVHNKGTLDII